VFQVKVGDGTQLVGLPRVDDLAGEAADIATVGVEHIDSLSIGADVD